MMHYIVFKKTTHCVYLHNTEVQYTLATKLNVSATKSTATSCRIHVVADLLNVTATKLYVAD